MIKILLVIVILFFFGYLNYKSIVARSKSLTEMILNNRKQEDFK